MEDQYGISDLRQYINGRSIFHPIVQPPDLLSGHGSLSLTPVLHQYPDQMNLLGRQVTEMVPPPGGGGGFHPDHFRTDSATTGVSVTTCGLSSGGGGCFSGLEMDVAAGFGAGDGGTGRWPRQETLTLLEIRSKLDSKFKEANHKGPLWDEVSRIMSEEHGYQRSGKKCREKFENLYKYYKKTKDGKAGRQDGKHYRFFRQLEALYGETSNAASSSFSANNHNLIINTSAFPNYQNASVVLGNNNSTSSLLLPNSNHESGLLQPNSKITAATDSLSLSNSSDFYSTSSEDVTIENEKIRKKIKKGKKNWKAKIKDFIDSQMRKIMDKQEVWLEKTMRNIEEKEQERIQREEDWKKQEAERVEREQKFWANERAWIEARDASLMDCLRKVTGKEVVKPYNNHYSDQELVLLHPPPTTEHHHPNTMISEGILESVPTSSSSAKKRKEDSRTCCYVMNGNDQWDETLRHGSSHEQQHSLEDSGGGAGVSTANMPYGGYRYLLGDAGNLWLNNGVKFSKGENC